MPPATGVPPRKRAANTPGTRSSGRAYSNFHVTIWNRDACHSNSFNGYSSIDDVSLL